MLPTWFPKFRAYYATHSLTITKDITSSTIGWYSLKSRLDFVLYARNRFEIIPSTLENTIKWLNRMCSDVSHGACLFRLCLVTPVLFRTTSPATQAEENIGEWDTLVVKRNQEKMETPEREEGSRTSENGTKALNVSEQIFEYVRLGFLMKTTMLKKLIVSEGTYTCKGCAPGRNLSLDPTFKRACGNLGTFAKCSSQVNTVS